VVSPCFIENKCSGTIPVLRLGFSEAETCRTTGTSLISTEERFRAHHFLQGIFALAGQVVPPPGIALVRGYPVK